jgi:predicted transcriptional regulator
MKKLTQAEEQIMQALWALDTGGYIKDLLEALDEPKPHHNTLATLLKILVEKQFVGIRNPNRNNFYHPLVTKESYSAKRIEGLTESYFEGSYANVVSFLVDKKQMSIQDLELLLKQLKNKSHD